MCNSKPKVPKAVAPPPPPTEVSEEVKKSRSNERNKRMQQLAANDTIATGAGGDTSQANVGRTILG